MALDGNHVLIGNLGDDTNGSNVGQAHLFTAVSEPSADFDEDGDVDGNDYLKWQRGESPNPLSAPDLADWQLNFGSSMTLSSSTAIPEPSALAMAVCCLIGLASRPCQRREEMS